MRDFNCVVILQSVLQVPGLTSVYLIRVRTGLQGIDVVIVTHENQARLRF
jgi:hypothetical protein